jgi:hypothetical protein
MTGSLTIISLTIQMRRKRMKFRATKYHAMFLASAFLLLALPAQALCCACCSNTGEWSQGNTSVDQYRFDEINRMVFAPLANTYMTDAGEDSTRGLTSPAENYKLSLSKDQRRWTLSFKDDKGKTGTLSFNIPASMLYFIVDLQNGQESAGGGPMLYHEWRLSGPVSGTGIFQRGIAGRTKFQLIFQGMGNSCADANTFKSWNLQITGPRAAYSFYGLFKEPKPAS